MERLDVVGPAASGKTHLAQIWARQTNALILQAATLLDADLASLSGRAVVVEDAHHLGPAEAQLFHLHNLAAASGAALLITARTAPRSCANARYCSSGMSMFLNRRNFSGSMPWTATRSPAASTKR